MMDMAFWMDNVLAACAALSAIVVAYCGWLCLTDLLEILRDWLSRRLHRRDEL